MPPGGEEAVVVGRVEGNNAGGAVPVGRVIALGQDDDHLLAVGGRADAALVIRGGVAVGASPALPVAAADDVDFVAGGQLVAAVVLQIGPFLLVRSALGQFCPRSKLGTRIARGARAVPAGGQVGVGAEIILPGGRAQPARAHAPAHPVGLALVAVVAYGVLVLVE